MIAIQIEAPDARFVRRLTGAERRLKDLRPLWDAVEPAVRQNFAYWFETEGQGSWPRLSPAYARYKAEKWGGQPLMVRSGQLRDSLVEVDRAGGLRKLGRAEAEWGTSVPYAIAHQRPERDWMPRRKVVVLTNRGRVAIRRATQAWIKRQIGGGR